MKIAYITAGAGGMYCGSCLRDNTLAGALQKLGHDCVLVPCYTPIRTDEQDVSGTRIFLGGVTVYLEQKVSWLRRMPAWLDRFLSQPWLLRWATGKAVSTQASELADMTISLLKGSDGHQKTEVARLCDWLANDFKPDVVIITNALMSGIVPELKRRLKVPVIITLQGDDIFLQELPAAAQKQCIELIQQNGQDVSGYITTCEYYADFMSSYLGLKKNLFRSILPGLNLEHFPKQPPAIRPEGELLNIGYFGRIAPEKGLHVLVDAVDILMKQTGHPKFQLKVAGYLPPHRQSYLEEQKQKAVSGGWADHFHYEGEPDRQAKVAFLSSMDLFSMPTTYREPKGLSVLEALACGIPVVQPEHGSFPEVLKLTEGGVLFEPSSAPALAEQLAKLLRTPEHRQHLGKTGQQRVHEYFTAERMAKDTMQVLDSVVATYAR